MKYSIQLICYLYFIMATNTFAESLIINNIEIKFIKNDTIEIKNIGKTTYTPILNGRKLEPELILTPNKSLLYKTPSNFNKKAITPKKPKPLNEEKEKQALAELFGEPVKK